MMSSNTVYPWLVLSCQQYSVPKRTSPGISNGPTPLPSIKALPLDEGIVHPDSGLLVYLNESVVPSCEACFVGVRVDFSKAIVDLHNCKVGTRIIQKEVV